MLKLQIPLCLIFCYLFFGKGYGCQFGFASHGGSCYALLRIQVTWAEALRVCEAAGSRLATIQSAEEQQWVDVFLRRLNSTIITPEVWLAGTDMLAEGVWRWADEISPMDYKNWAPGEPDNIGHEGRTAHCLGLFRNKGHTWDDDYCEKKLQPLCKNEDENPPEKIIYRYL